MHRAIKSNYEFSLWIADDTEVVTSQLCVHVKTLQIVKLVHTHMTRGGMAIWLVSFWLVKSKINRGRYILAS